MKFINLIIYSKRDDYDNMKVILENYYKTFSNVLTLFLAYDPNMKTDLKLVDNILYIKGTETLIPGILNKTVKAFEYIIDKMQDYDYIVRTNISTIINFDLLANELARKPIKFYGGGKVLNLQWHGGGINDNKWFGTNFIVGTGIIFSKEAIVFIINNNDCLRQDIVDDVSFGIFFREHAYDIFPEEVGKYIEVPYLIKNNNEININVLNEIVSHNFIFYRNNCNFHKNREIDILQMQAIVELLMKKNT